MNTTNITMCGMAMLKMSWVWIPLIIAMLGTAYSERGTV